MTHYIAIFLPDQSGEWRALFPDVPGCEAHGHGLMRVKKAAADFLSEQARMSALRSPRTLQEIERDEEWLIRNGVDFDRAIVAIVPWPVDPFPWALGSA